MEPPAALVLDFSNLRTATPGMDCEDSALMADAGSDDAAVIRANDQIHLAPRICRFFNAYRDSDALRRAEFRKAIACVSHRFGFVSPGTPSLQEDIAAALCIAQDAADIAFAIDAGATIDEVGFGSVDVDLLADAYVTLALAYRYVVGLYVTELRDLGEVAVRLVLLAEAEYDSPDAGTEIALVRPAMTRGTFRPNQEIVSAVSISVELAASPNKGVSLEAISQRLKDQILLMA